MNQPVDAVDPAPGSPAPGSPRPDAPAPPPSPPTGDLAAALPEDAPEPPPPRACENCGTPLLGEHCYRCGQPTRGMVRHFSTILGDLIDTVFNFDSRTVRSIGPLLFRPGRLTHEYFEGHRVRFVSPVRLFFFFCVAAFLALQFSVDTDSSFNFDGDGTDISEATTVGDVEKLRDDALKDLEEAKVEAADAPGAAAGLEIGMAAVRDEATRRIEWIAARDKAIAEGKPEPEYDDDDSRQPFNFKFDGMPWDVNTNPVTIDWLPAMANAQLNRMIARAQRNIEDIQHKPGLLFEAFLQTLPQTLFILLPVFALLLKIVYLFKRRLYMEHLIVALHSHAFLCAALLVIVGVSDLGDLFADGGFWSGVCDWAIIAMAWWMPIYLLIMQKRVYRQGWIMTLLKYSVLALCYMVLISCAVTLTLAFNLVAM